MRFLALAACLAALTSSARSQQPSADPDFLENAREAQSVRLKIEKTKVPNPFDAQPSGGMAMGGGMEAMEGMMGGMLDEGMDMGGMGMGMAPGEVGMEFSSDDRFRHGLQRAIKALKGAKTDSEKEMLRGYVREAFEDRYAKMITSRKRDLERLKQSVAKLEGDLKRREAAKERVVEVQMQSVQLAAEGLLELGELRGLPGGMNAGVMGSMGEFGGGDYSP